MKFFVYINIFLIGCSATTTSNGNRIPSSKDTDLANQITTMDSAKADSIAYTIVFQLPEIKEKNEFVEKLTNHKKGVSLIIQARPTKDFPYYWIQAGYISDKRFEVYFNFYVYNENWQIKYLDVINNKILSLEEWRKK